jgi:Fungal ubiquitin-associated domain
MRSQLRAWREHMSSSLSHSVLKGPKWCVRIDVVGVVLLRNTFLRQIDVLRRLNYRGANVPNIAEDRVVEELLK